MPGGRIVLVGMPIGPVALDIVSLQAKEASIETVFRYAHVYPRALALMGSGKIDLKPLINRTFEFQEGVDALISRSKCRPIASRRKSTLAPRRKRFGF